MKRILLLLFILHSIYAEHMIPIENKIINFGIINFNGYRNHIFSTGLDEKVINLPTYKLSPVHCTEDDYLLAIKPKTDICYLIGRTNGRQLNIFEWNSSVFDKISLNSINIHSENKTGNEQLIHHSFFIKSRGTISIGAGMVINFSPIHCRGFKNLLLSSYSNKLFGILTLYEVNKYYITPFYRNQSDGWRTRITFNLTPFKWVGCEYLFLYHNAGKVLKTENSVKVEIFVPFNTLTIKTKVKSREEKSVKKSHFIESISLKSDIFNLRNIFNFELNYINALFYKGFNSVTYKALKDSLNIDVKYSWEYVMKLTHNFSSSIKYKRDDWILSMNYKTPLVNETGKWSFTGSLKQKF